MEEKRCYTVKDLQSILGVTRQTVYELLKSSEFRWVKIGSSYRISKKALTNGWIRVPKIHNLRSQ